MNYEMNIETRGEGLHRDKEDKKSFVIEYLIIISVIMNVFVNVISFYFTGNKNDLVRKIISHGLIAIIVLLLLLYVVQKFFSSSAVMKRTMVVCALPLAVNMLVCLVGIIKSEGRADILNSMLACGSYSVPIVCSAIYIMAEGKFDSIVSRVKYLTIIMIPYWLAALKCFFGLRDEEDILVDFGSISYLAIGYSAAIIYAALLCDLALHFYKKSMNKAALGLILVEMAICSAISYMTGGRGPCLSWISVNVVGAFFLFIKREQKAIIGIILSVAIVAILPSNNAAANRQLALLNEWKSGGLMQAIASKESEEIVNELYNKSDALGGFKMVIEEIKAAHSGGAQTDEPFEPALYSITNGSMARIYLWRLAIKEMQNQPLQGKGVFGFQLKYRTYAHNVLFECLADFGILTFIIFAGMCCMLIFMVFKYSAEERKFWNLIIISCTPAVRAMMSGDLYNCPVLLFVSAVVIWKYLEYFEICKKNKTISIGME